MEHKSYLQVVFCGPGARMGTKEHGPVVWIEDFDVAVSPADGRMAVGVQPRLALLREALSLRVSFGYPLVANTPALPFSATVTILPGQPGL